MVQTFLLAKEYFRFGNYMELYGIIEVSEVQNLHLWKIRLHLF